MCGKDLLSLSLGAAFYPQDGLDTEQFLAEADRKMYAANKFTTTGAKARRQSRCSILISFSALRPNERLPGDPLVREGSPRWQSHKVQLDFRWRWRTLNQPIDVGWLRFENFPVRHRRICTKLGRHLSYNR